MVWLVLIRLSANHFTEKIVEVSAIHAHHAEYVALHEQRTPSVWEVVETVRVRGS
jgi:hypothetical protein